MYPPSGTYNVSYHQDMAIVRTNAQRIGLLALLILLFVLPIFSSTYVLRLFITIGVAIISVHGVNILVGYCGQITLGHAAFMAVGGYTSAILVSTHHFPFWIALPLAGLSAAAIGTLFGLPSVRVKGLYLALSTLAAQFVITWGIVRLSSLTGGAVGMEVTPPSIAGFTFDSPHRYYYIVAVVTVVMTFFAKNLVRTGLGRAFVAVRDNDIAAESISISPFYYKLLAFFIGCFFAGIAGSLWIHYAKWVAPEFFSLMDSVWYIGMIIVGGLGATIGPIFGAIFLTLLREVVFRLGPTIAEIFPWVSSSATAGILLIFFALVIILFLVFEPRGLAHRWQVFKASYRLWPFSY